MICDVMADSVLSYWVGYINKFEVFALVMRTFECYFDFNIEV